jgi:hypothetical protein
MVFSFLMTSAATFVSSSAYFSGSAAADGFFPFFDCFDKKAFKSFFFSLIGNI